MSFFGVNVNPFSTPVGQKIEQATDGSLPSENWALNMEICDIINETEDGPRDAIKAIKRRLNQAAGKNYTIFMYTLTVLETCVKNCGKRFHAHACSREFVQELIKLIGPKNEPPTAVQEKVLSLIQTWADTFRHQPHTQGVVQIYQELKVKGIQFPMTDLDAMAPIITPERSVPETEQNATNMPVTEIQSIIPTLTQPQQQQQLQQQHQHQQQLHHHQYHHQQQQQQQQLQNQMSGSQLTHLNEQQMAKLQSELDVVQGNMRVLSEMLLYLTSPDQSANQQPDSADLELLTELHATCKAMQERVVDLIGKLAHDEMTAELLRINDELNNLFLRYSRYTKNKTVVPASAILAQAIGHPATVDSNELHVKRDAADSLIDLSDENDGLTKQVAAMGIVDNGDKSRPERKEKEGDGDEFDMFAQSRNATYESTKNSGSKYDDNLEQMSGGSLSTAILNRNSPKYPQQIASAVASAATTSLNRESEFSEMAAWLNRTPGAQGDQESLTSSEFERFLAERAAAAEALPNISPTIATSASTMASESKSAQPLSPSPPPPPPPSSSSSSSSSPAPPPPPPPPISAPLSTPISNTANSENANVQRQINKEQDKSLFAL